MIEVGYDGVGLQGRELSWYVVSVFAVVQLKWLSGSLAMLLVSMYDVVGEILRSVSAYVVQLKWLLEGSILRCVTVLVESLLSVECLANSLNSFRF